MRVEGRAWQQAPWVLLHLHSNVYHYVHSDQGLYSLSSGFILDFHSGLQFDATGNTSQCDPCLPAWQAAWHLVIRRIINDCVLFVTGPHSPSLMPPTVERQLPSTAVRICAAPWLAWACHDQNSPTATRCKHSEPTLAVIYDAHMTFSTTSGYSSHYFQQQV